MDWFKTVVLYVSSFVGPMFLTLAARAQELFPPIIEPNGLKSWFIAFGVGAVFTVAFWLVKRFLTAWDELNKSVQSIQLSIANSEGREKLMMAQIVNNTAEQNKLANRVNGHGDWMHKHEKDHAAKGRRTKPKSDDSTI